MSYSDPTMKNAVALQNTDKRGKMLKDAQSVYPINLGDCDADSNLFNCQNVTLNLATGEVLPHNPDHLLRKVAGAVHDPAARLPRWDSFLDEIMQGDREKTRYLQKLFGYCLLGEPVEDKLFLFYGPTTRNGKSTLLDAISAVFGDYAHDAPPEMLAEPFAPDGDRPKPALASLHGVRLCTINEPSDGLRLNAAQVKAITGGDKMSVRSIYQKPFEFTPQFSMVINTNHLPNIHDPTLFKSGRVVVIPFERHFEEYEQDKNLDKVLQSPQGRSAILNWLLEGLNLYRKEGLDPPAAVRNAVAAYELESDKIQQFMDDHIITDDPNARTLADAVYCVYSHWCDRNGYGTESRKRFSQAFKTKGIEPTRTKRGMEYKGIAVRHSVEPEPF